MGYPISDKPIMTQIPGQMSSPCLPLEVIWAATHPSEDVNRTSPLSSGLRDNTTFIASICSVQVLEDIFHGQSSSDWIIINNN